MSNLPKRQQAVNRSRAGDAFSRLVVTAFRLDGALSAAGDSIAQPAGQTTARWRVLAAVERQPLTVAQIARAWSFARQSVQRVADALEADGLVRYDDNPSHRRAKLVTLTTAGRRALAKIQASQREWADEVGSQLGAADLEAADAILTRLLDVLASSARRR
jgi:DNA-binding MarR family transcriptional regulator